MTTENLTNVFRVSADTDTKKLGGAIATGLKQKRDLRLSAVGAGAVNQAVKAVAIARGYLAVEALDVLIRPSFASSDDNVSVVNMDLVLERI